MAKKRYDLRPVRTVCIYARYSPGSRQTDQSIEGQLRVCQEYAEQHDYRIIQTYADKHKTGTNDDREAFRQMIKDSEKGLFDAVLVWKSDRFGRNMEDMVLNEMRIKRNGVSLISCTEPVADGPLGGMQKAMLMGMAEFYSATNAENVRRGLLESARKCQITSGAIPFGYKAGEDKRFYTDPINAAAVLEIFQRYDGGELLTHIMEDLNKKGIRSHKGKPLTRSSMYSILRNERYTGVYIYADIRVEGGMPQIVPKDLYERVQIKLGKNKHAPARAKAAEPFILTTKCFCGQCGGPMAGESGTSKTGAKHYYYGCVHHKNSRDKSKACQKKPVRKDFLERLVIDTTLDVALHKENIQSIAADLCAWQQRQKDTAILDGLKSRRRECEKAIGNLVAALEAGAASPTIAARVRDREEELENIKFAIAEQELVQEKFDEKKIMYFLSKVPEGDRTDINYMQRIVDTFINSVFVYDDRVVICYNFDGDGSKITVNDVDKAMQEAEDRENRQITQEAPGQGGSCVESDDSKCSPYGGLVRGNEPKANSILFFQRAFGIIVKLQ